MIDLTKAVGPVMQSGDVANAVVAAAEEDNPGREIHLEDRGAYIRIDVENECVIRRQTVEDMIGRPFKMYELEAFMSAFNGQIETDTEFVRFYLASA